MIQFRLEIAKRTIGAVLFGLLAVSLSNLPADAAVTAISSIAYLRSNNLVSTPDIWVQGYYGLGTNGGGSLSYVSSDTTSADNGCTIFVDSASHRFYRVPAPSQEGISAYQCGYVGNGASHPLSGYFSTLPAAKAVYPFVSTLSDEMDGVAIQAAIYSVSPLTSFNPAHSPSDYFKYGGTVFVPTGLGFFNQTIYLNFQVRLTAIGTPVPGSGLATQNPCNNFSAATGASVLCWTGSSQGIGIDATGFYKYTTNPSLSGTATGGSAQSGFTLATITFNASAVPGIANGTFAGSVITVTGGTGSSNSPRLILSGSYNAGTGIYTASVLNNWDNGVPTGTTTFSIASVTAGQRFTATEGIAGANYFDGGNGSGQFQLTLTNGVDIKNLTVVSNTGGYAAFRLNGVPASHMSRLASAGFNACWYVNASYYSSLEDSNCSFLHEGVAQTNDSWMSYKNVATFATPNAGGTDISRPGATGREWFVGAAAVTGADPNPYQASGLYQYGGGFLNWDGGDLGEGADRGATLLATNAVFSGAYMEGIGHYKKQTGQAGVFLNGTAVRWTGGGWYSIYTPYIPMFTGITPHLTVSDLYQQSGSSSQFFGTFDFTFGGSVRAINVTPGSGDVAPSAGTNFTWDAFPILSSGGLSLSNGWSAAGSTTVSAQDIKGLIKLQGYMTGGTTTVGTLIATLPTGYRPSQDVYSPAPCGSALNAFCTLRIWTNGSVTIQTAPASAGLSLEGISFASTTGY